MVTHMCVITPGPARSARTVVSPGIGRLLSSLEFQSGLFDEERCAEKSLGSRRRNGSGSPGAGCCAEAALAAPTNRARPTVIAREFIGVPPVRDILRRAMRLRSALLVLAIAAPLTAQEPTPAAASEPTPAPAADPVLAGAGDIADCGRLSGAAK